MALNIEERPLSQAASELDLAARQPSHSGLTETAMDGDFRRFGIRLGLELSVYDLRLQNRFRRTANMAPGLTIVLLQHATGSSILKALDGDPRAVRLDYDPRSALMIFSRTPLSGCYDVPADTRFRGIEIRASEAFLRRLDATALFEQALGGHPLTVAATGSFWVGRFPATEMIDALAAGLVASGLDRCCEDLAIEARCLDLLTAAISMVREPLLCHRTKILRDSRKLNEAKNTLLRQLDRSWTIHDLATCVGLSDKRLKDGFRQQFGLPVYSFLQKSRMEEARTLLARDGATVTETALAVGYANPSRFSQLFLREYGMTPSDFVRRKVGAHSDS